MTFIIDEIDYKNNIFLQLFKIYYVVYIIYTMATFKKRYRKKRKVYTKFKKAYRKFKTLHHYDGRSVLVNPSRTLGFPDTYRTTMRYTVAFQLTTAGVDPLEIINFKLNNVYDPDPIVRAGVTATPYTQLSTIYRNYQVYGAKVKCTFTPDLVTAGNPCTFIIYPYDVNALALDNSLGEMVSVPRGAYKQIIPARVINPVVLRKFWKIRDIAGYPWIDKDFIGQTGTNSVPVRDIRFAVALNAINSADDMTGWVTVDIIYYVDWFSRIGNIDFGMGD
nr:MAG TPA: Capsid protein [Bacteriophage sp.]